MQKCLIWMLLRIKITRMMTKKWPYRMLIIGPSGSGETNALLNLIQKKRY